ncbi:phenylacetate--CoA ligase family protein [Candidatus Sumerlaeota bacterium]|nr:phenylacetate--CoA ligase family protein [Candidatus Sumerlaeota bacterium]
MINPWTVRHVVYPWVFPLLKRAPGRRIMRLVERWEEQSRWPPERHAEESLRRIQGLVRHAFENVPLYREKYRAAGVEPGDIRTWEDFSRLPRLTRDDLHGDREHILAGNVAARDRQFHHSSGSTGVPATFWIDRERASLIFANYHLNMRWIGSEVGERQAWLWPDQRGPRGRGTRLRRFQMRLLNRIFLISPTLDDEPMAYFHRRLTRFRPELLVSFPTRMAYFLRFCRRHGLSVPQIPRLLSTGETLHDHQRTDFAEAFGAEVYDRYGSIELGDIAHECTAHEGLHINSHRVNVETVPVEGLDGDQGMMVITDLDNLATPFIRYECGDIGQLWPEGTRHACPCGRTLPRLVRVLGRVRDAIESPSGRVYSRVVYSRVAREIPGIRLHQIIQRPPNTLVYRCQVDSEFPEDGRELIARVFAEKTDHEFQIEVEVVDHLEMTPSGKLKMLIRE